jgi:2-oxo-4-hydroxy-4-carboxy-5-ureidoimidazoline decarboxylase
MTTPHDAPGLARFNELPAEDAARELRSCCGSTRWIDGMLAVRPFPSAAAMLDAADKVWATTSEADWHEAFRAHPRIGESKAQAGQSATAKGWSSQEQAGAKSADEATKQALAEINRAYEQRFGFIYIVCATGKTADEMLAIAKSRLNNAPDAELRIAAAEQHKITRLRLEKLLAS